jgi:hypothetical protein
MKNTKAGLLTIAAAVAGLFAFTTFSGGTIKGKIIPADGASQVWALSATDTLKAAISQGNFTIPEAKGGSYKVYIDAVDPYKDVVKAKGLAQIKTWPVRSRPGDPSGGVTCRATEPEKTDGSARGSWGLGLRKQRF